MPYSWSGCTLNASLSAGQWGRIRASPGSEFHAEGLVGRDSRPGNEFHFLSRRVKNEEGTYIRARV